MELQSAQLELADIATTDSANFLSLTQMSFVLYNLATETNYVLGLSDSQRMTLSGILQTIGRDVLDAYTKYGDFPNATSWTLAWYWGPVPPDKNLLGQAYHLATTLPGLPLAPYILTKYSFKKPEFQNIAQHTTDSAGYNLSFSPTLVNQ